jgi:hypothetical protein
MRSDATKNILESQAAISVMNDAEIISSRSMHLAVWKLFPGPLMEERIGPARFESYPFNLKPLQSRRVPKLLVTYSGPCVDVPENAVPHIFHI